jgi:hypothetical protein
MSQAGQASLIANIAVTPCARIHCLRRRADDYKNEACRTSTSPKVFSIFISSHLKQLVNTGYLLMSPSPIGIWLRVRPIKSIFNAMNRAIDLNRRLPAGLGLVSGAGLRVASPGAAGSGGW